VNLVETEASAGVGSWTLIANGFAYELFGPVKALAFGNGLCAPSSAAVLTVVHARSLSAKIISPLHLRGSCSGP